jgi:hypothetical protein
MAAAGGIALVVAACGSSPSSVSSAGSAGSSNAGSSSDAGGSAHFQQAVAFAQCMRTHGVPDMPDPDPSGAFRMPPSVGAAARQSQPFQAALNACKHLYPSFGQAPSQAQQQQMTARRLSFARCMRSHGVPDFPDPDSYGFIPTGPSGPQGVTTASPQYQSAYQACKPLVAGLPGKETGGGS